MFLRKLCSNGLLTTCTQRKFSAQAGSIRLIMGPMYSGKTTRLLALAREALNANRKVVVIKFSKDVRYGSDASLAVTHDHVSHPALAVSQLHEVCAHPDVVSADVICVDEGQFYEDVTVQCDTWADAGKQVIVAAQDSTFQRMPFKNISNLISKADMIEKVLATCHTCGNPAAFSKRLTKELEEVVIGGADKYHAACRSCYHKL